VPADGDLDGLGERVGVLVPDPGQEILGAEDTGGCFEEGLEHGEFLDRDVDVAAVAGDGAAERVEFYPGRAQDARPGVGLAAGQGADPQHEFGDVEGLGQVVVGAQGQAGDPVAGGAGGGEHEDHDRVAGRSDRAADRVAVDAGQVAVQDEHVVGVQVQLEGGVRAVAGDIGGDALIT
jgi:hypothetical protein